MRRRIGMNLVEVMLSLGVLGVACGWYGTIFRGTSANREACERWVIAMELAREQIDFLRRQTETDPTVLPVAARAPFVEADVQDGAPTANPMVCPPFPFTGSAGGRVNNLQPASPARPGGVDTFLDAAGATFSWRFPDTSQWVVRSVGPFNPGGAPQMPVDVAAKGFTVEVRASRVRKDDFESQLIHYQVTVRQNGTPLLVVPYIKRMVWAGG